MFLCPTRFSTLFEQANVLLLEHCLLSSHWWSWEMKFVKEKEIGRCIVDLLDRLLDYRSLHQQRQWLNLLLKSKRTMCNDVKCWIRNSFTSWGGTLNVDVRRSTRTIVSTQGKIKNNPGPLAPPKKKENRSFVKSNRTINDKQFTGKNPTKSKYDGSFVFLNNLIGRKHEMKKNWRWTSC